MAVNTNNKERLSPNELSYGLVENVSPSHVQIKDLVTNEKQIIEYMPEDNLEEIFTEMLGLGMPVIVVPGEKTKSTTRFLGSLPFVVADFKNKDLGLIGTFKGADATEFFVTKTNPFFKTIVKKVRKSKKEETEYWFAISDVRLKSNGNRQYEILNVLTQREQIKCDANFFGVPEFDELAVEPVNERTLRRLFLQIQRLSTNPSSGPLQGIPFLYVANGCEDRCHEMCRIILQRRIHPIKVWVFEPMGPIIYDTPNDPDCRVIWAYHTAPAVATIHGYRVIDPSTDDEPVSVAQWYSKFRTSTTQLHYSSHHVYKMLASLCPFLADPKYEMTEERLRIYRIKLRLDSILFGPPPYRHCLI